AEKSVGSKVQPNMGVRADYERRIPIPTQGIFATANLRLNADALAGALVVANEITVLQLGVNSVRVLRVDLCPESVTALSHPPVAVNNSRGITRARRPAEGKVILRASEDVIERRGVISRYVIELRHRQVTFEVPICAAVVAFINAAVTADQVMLVVVGIDPNLVIVNVFRFFSQAAQGPASII